MIINFDCHFGTFFMEDPDSYNEPHGYKVNPPRNSVTHTTNAANPKCKQEYTLETLSRNVENISKITPETQLHELCPVWKTSFQPKQSNF